MSATTPAPPSAPRPAPSRGSHPDPATEPRLPPPQPASTNPDGPRGRRILGIQPPLLVGIVLLTLVTLLTIALVFVGDIETQAPRVAWTIVAIAGFTGLLALDLTLGRRSALPLVIGVAANTYLLAILMLATWMGSPAESVASPAASLVVALLGAYLLGFVVVRAAAAGAWALVVLGRRGVLLLARAAGIVAASLVGLAAVLITLPLAITPLGLAIGDLYWRATVAVVVLAALAACVTTLLRWSRRELEPRMARQDAPATWPSTASQPQPHAWPTHHVPPGCLPPGPPPQAWQTPGAQQSQQQPMHPTQGHPGPRQQPPPH